MKQKKAAQELTLIPALMRRHHLGGEHAQDLAHALRKRGQHASHRGQVILACGLRISINEGEGSAMIEGEERLGHISAEQLGHALETAGINRLQVHRSAWAILAQLEEDRWSSQLEIGQLDRYDPRIDSCLVVHNRFIIKQNPEAALQQLETRLHLQQLSRVLN